MKVITTVCNVIPLSLSAASIPIATAERNKVKSAKPVVRHDSTEIIPMTPTKKDSEYFFI